METVLVLIIDCFVLICNIKAGDKLIIEKSCNTLGLDLFIDTSK